MSGRSGLVGRTAELERLLDAVARARAGQGSMTLIAGAAAVVPGQVGGLAAAGDLRGPLQGAVAEVRGGRAGAVEGVARVDEPLGVEREEVAAWELAVRALGSSEKRDQAPAALAQREG